MKKWQIENSEKSEISEKSYSEFSFFPSFRFCSTAKFENSDLKISEKIFRDFRDFQVFRVFNLALLVLQLLWLLNSWLVVEMYSGQLKPFL